MGARGPHDRATGTGSAAVNLRDGKLSNRSLETDWRKLPGSRTLRVMEGGWTHGTRW
jgi:hypothetical protein